MREALTALIDHAFGPMKLRRLEADVDPRNVNSMRILGKLGFSQEGLLRERWNVNGEIQDTAFLGLLAREWRGARRMSAITVVPFHPRYAGDFRRLNLDWIERLFKVEAPDLKVLDDPGARHHRAGRHDLLRAGRRCGRRDGRDDPRHGRSL